MLKSAKYAHAEGNSGFRVVFSPDGKRLARYWPTGPQDWFVRLWDAYTGQELLLLKDIRTASSAWPIARTANAWSALRRTARCLFMTPRRSRRTLPPGDRRGQPMRMPVVGADDVSLPPAWFVKPSRTARIVAYSPRTQTYFETSQQRTQLRPSGPQLALSARVLRTTHSSAPATMPVRGDNRWTS
jgi:hypothetical protein